MNKDTEEELTMAQQIERTSINIFTFSAMDDQSGIPLNIPNILGGEALITDNVAKLKIEEAFGQLNIQNLFGFADYVLVFCMYDTFHVKSELEGQLTPYIYLLKSRMENVYLMNLLVTPYADLDLDSYFQEVEFMSESYSGVFRRTSHQVEENVLSPDEQIRICHGTVDNLSGYIHYVIFTERGLTQPIEDTTNISVVMFLGLFLKLKVVSEEFQCFGSCGKTFEHDFAGISEETMLCPECNGDLISAPPVIVIENVQFIYPDNFSDYIGYEDEHAFYPSKYIGYITQMAMPRNVSTTTNRLSPDHFSSLATIPSDGLYVSNNDPTDIVTIKTNWRREKGSIDLFCSLGSSNLAKVEASPFIPQLTAINVNRDIVEGMQKRKSLSAILKNSLLYDWNLSEPVKFEKLGLYDRVEKIGAV